MLVISEVLWFLPFTLLVFQSTAVPLSQEFLEVSIIPYKSLVFQELTGLL